MQTTINQREKKKQSIDTVCNVSIVSNGPKNSTKLKKKRYEFKREKKT